MLLQSLATTHSNIIGGAKKKQGKKGWGKIQLVYNTLGTTARFAFGPLNHIATEHNQFSIHSLMEAYYE